MMEHIELKGLYSHELDKVIESFGEKAFRSKQLYTWLHQQKIQSYDEISNLPKKIIDRLKESYRISSLKEVQKLVDQTDQTTKYLFELSDGNVLETVLMKYKYGYSVCISSQVGCKMGCTFCASTIGGLVRNLTAAEMLEQIYYIEKEIQDDIHSVVIMGTGEPLDNYDELIRFIRLISDEKGRNLSRRHITVSTCGLIDKMKLLAIDAPQVNLAISLHSPTQTMRKSVMPVAGKFPLEELIEACKRYTDTTGRRITFEYSLIKGVNDQEKHAKILVKLLKGMLCHVNLIPVNPVDERNHEATDIDARRRFMQILEGGHIQVTMRRSLGAEIDAACGQLRNRYEKGDN